MKANVTYNMIGSNLDDSSIVEINKSGANVVWDFSNVTNSYNYTHKFELAANGLGADSFPEANYVEADYVDSTWMYYAKTDTALYMVGQYGDVFDGGMGAIKMKMKYLQFPCTYQSSYNSHTTDTTFTTVEDDSIFIPARVIVDISMNNTVDGWGILKLPQGNFHVLRRSMTMTLRFKSAANVFGTWMDMEDDSTRTKVYSWLSNDPNVSWTLAEASYYEDGDSWDFEYLDTVPGNPATIDTSDSTGNTGITFNKTNTVTVSPNPAHDFVQLTLKQDSPYKLLVYSGSGQQIRNEDFKGNKHQLDISELPAGQYFYLLVNKESKETMNGKFIKR